MPVRSPPKRDLDALLVSVSRSFYFSLRVLPAAIRPQLSVAYLVARAADTIADGLAIPDGRRRDLLAALRRAVSGGEGATSLAALLDATPFPAASPSERANLAALCPCLALVEELPADDVRRTRQLLLSLLDGMERDVARFPTPPVGAPPALPTMEALDQHLYDAAGCVGAYWARTVAAHDPAARALLHPTVIERAVHLGKALQLVNVIRDLTSDLAVGRCYVPLPMLRRHGLTPSEIADAAPDRIRPLVDELRAMALAHVDAAWPWVGALPARGLRLRLACIWPLWLALGTIAKAGVIAVPLSQAGRPRVTRGALYRTLIEAALVALVSPLLERAHARRRRLAARGLPERSHIAEAPVASAEAWRS